MDGKAQFAIIGFYFMAGIVFGFILGNKNKKW